MQFKFIAINGDNVGDSIGNAIASDNHEELDRITGGLKNAHGEIDKWVESIGGKVVTSSGDEGIYKVPADSFDESTLENLRNQYSQSTGTTITVGIGDSMSEASKALIYGKLNDKDQIVDYDPHIDDYIAGHDDEAIEDEEEFNNEDEEALPSSDGLDEEIVQDSEDEEAGFSDEEIDPEAMDGQEAVDGEFDDAQLDPSMEGEGEGEDESLAEEGEMSEDDLDIKPEDRLKEIVGQDLDGDGDVDSIEASDESLPSEDEEFMGVDEDGDGDMEEGMADLDGDGDVDAEFAEDDTENQMDDQSAISDMIHSNMGGEEEEMDGDDEELRQDIVNSLMTFKENKAMLEQAKTQNPKLYQATILMLRSMIEMAKKLNMNPEADMAGQEAQAALPDAEMDGMEGQEEMPEPEMAEEEMPEQEAEGEMDEEEEEDDALPAAKPKPFGKSEVAKLYSNLLKGIDVLSKAEKKYWRDEIRERERKAKEARKPKKINGKKPLDHALEEVERKMKVKKEVTSKKK